MGRSPVAHTSCSAPSPPPQKLCSPHATSSRARLETCAIETRSLRSMRSVCHPPPHSEVVGHSRPAGDGLFQRRQNHHGSLDGAQASGVNYLTDSDATRRPASGARPHEAPGVQRQSIRSRQSNPGKRCFCRARTPYLGDTGLAVGWGSLVPSPPSAQPSNTESGLPDCETDVTACDARLIHRERFLSRPENQLRAVRLIIYFSHFSSFATPAFS